MTVYAITDTKKGEQGLRLLIFKLPKIKSQPSIQQSLKWLNPLTGTLNLQLNGSTDMW